MAMRAAVYAQRGGEDLELAGHLVVTEDGDVMPVPSGVDLLEELADTPVSVWNGTDYETVAPEDDPFKFLVALEKAYSGTALRVGIEDDGEDGFTEAWDPGQHPRHPAGTPSGGEFSKVGTSTMPGSEPRRAIEEYPTEVQQWLREIEQHPEFVKARQIISTQTPTDKRFTRGGVYLPERAAMHHDIVESMLNPNSFPRPGEQPVFVLYAGAGGSGKGTVLRPFLPMSQDRFTVINADDVKEKIPEYNGYNAAIVHEESSHVSDNLLLRTSLLERRHILFDGTGKTYDKYLDMADLAHRYGYRVELLFAAVPPHISVKRAADRFMHMVHNGDPKPRYVDPRYLLANVDSKPFETYDKLKATGAIDRAVKVDNSGERTPRLVEDIRIQHEAESPDRPGRVSRVVGGGDDAEGGGGLGAGPEPDDLDTVLSAFLEERSRPWEPTQHPRHPAGSPSGLGGQFSPAGGGGTHAPTARIKAVGDAARQALGYQPGYGELHVAHTLAVELGRTPTPEEIRYALEHAPKPPVTMPHGTVMRERDNGTIEFLWTSQHPRAHKQVDRVRALAAKKGFTNEPIMKRGPGETTQTMFHDSGATLFWRITAGPDKGINDSFIRLRVPRTAMFEGGVVIETDVDTAIYDLFEEADPDHRHLVEYSPNQPRDPKGSETGGQWAPAGGSKNARVAQTFVAIHNAASKEFAAAFKAVGASMWRDDDAQPLKPSHLEALQVNLQQKAANPYSLSIPRPLTVLDGYPNVSVAARHKLDVAVDKIRLKYQKIWETERRRMAKAAKVDRSAGMRRDRLASGGVEAEKQRAKDAKLARGRETQRIIKMIRDRAESEEADPDHRPLVEYAPSQRRDPKGTPTGGQWAAGAGGSPIQRTLREKLAHTTVVDVAGDPVRVYHGTDTAFSDFDPSRASPRAALGKGIYFTGDPREASGWASSGDGNVRPAYLDLRRPLEMNAMVDPAMQQAVAREVEKELQRLVPKSVRDVIPNATDADIAKAMKLFLSSRLSGFNEPMQGTSLHTAVWTGLMGFGEDVDVNEILRRAGFDGIHDSHGWGPDKPRRSHWVVFSPKQVHSAFSESELAEYSANQPRDPKGSPTGGQWTKAGGSAGAEALDASAFDNGSDDFIELMHKKFPNAQTVTTKIDKQNTLTGIVLPKPLIAYHVSTKDLSKSGISPKSSDLTVMSTNLGGPDNANYYAEYKLGEGDTAYVYIHAILIPAGRTVYEAEATRGQITVGEPGQFRTFEKIPAHAILGVKKVRAYWADGGEKLPSTAAIKQWAAGLAKP